MNIPDSLIRLVKSTTGVQETSVVARYICDALVEYEFVKKAVVIGVLNAMTSNEEFINESPQERRERLERIERG